MIKSIKIKKIYYPAKKRKSTSGTTYNLTLARQNR